VSTIRRIYLSHFLIGLVFWYSIEKLFMRSIGIDAAGIGLMLAFMLVLMLALDVPAGILADRWSRRGMLMVAVALLGACSVVMGLSTGFWGYLVGTLLYGLYLVGTSGTYQALVYDVLHEEGRAQEYSRVMGAAYGLFLVGAGIANISGGLLAQVLPMQWNYLVTVIPCALNVWVLSGVVEPRFHRLTGKGTFVRELGDSLRLIGKTAVLRSVVMVWSALMIVEVFKQDFSQLYMLKFTDSTVVIGVLWAVYAFAWAFGSYIAHRLARWLTPLVLLSAGLTVALAFVQSVWGLGLFMAQVVAAAAAFNLFETRVQHATPSAVRTSIMSVVSTISRVVQLPSVLGIGWLIQRYDVFVTIQWLAVAMALVMGYWMLVGARRLRSSEGAELGDLEPEMSPKFDSASALKEP
jgi:MFS family permease